MNNMKKFSFNFNGRNSRTDFGILATSYDFLFPQKRERKQQIPFRHGKHDFGAKYFDERKLKVRCVWATSRLMRMTRSDMREVSDWLSHKGKIEFAVEPDKYYIGEIYDSEEITAHYNYSTENIDTTDGSFEVEFICEPFAYGALVEETIGAGMNRVEYKGTAETPCLMILKNNNDYALNNIQITVTRRKQ